MDRKNRQFRLPLSLKWFRFLGKVMRLAGVVGTGLTVIIMILVPIGTVQVISISEQTLEGFSEGLSDLKSEVEELEGLLDGAISILEGAGNSLERIEGSLEDTRSVIASTGDLLSTQTPEVIESTIEALETATAAARVVDFVLQGLGSLEPLTGVAYDPEEPLDQTMADVSASLEPLPADLIEVGEQLIGSIENLDQVGRSLNNVSANLKRFAGNMGTLQEQLSTIVDLVDDLSNESGELSPRIGLIFWAGCFIVEAFFIWVLLGQIALYYIGQQMSETAGEPQNLET